MTLKIKRTKAIWGFIVGEAMDVYYEFSDRKIMDKKIVRKKILKKELNDEKRICLLRTSRPLSLFIDE